MLSIEEEDIIRELELSASAILSTHKAITAAQTQANATLGAATLATTLENAAHGVVKVRDGLSALSSRQAALTAAGDALHESLPPLEALVGRARNLTLGSDVALLKELQSDLTAYRRCHPPAQVATRLNDRVLEALQQHAEETIRNILQQIDALASITPANATVPSINAARQRLLSTCPEEIVVVQQVYPEKMGRIVARYCKAAASANTALIQGAIHSLRRLAVKEGPVAQLADKLGKPRKRENDFVRAFIGDPKAFETMMSDFSSSSQVSLHESLLTLWVNTAASDRDFLITFSSYLGISSPSPVENLREAGCLLESQVDHFIATWPTAGAALRIAGVAARALRDCVPSARSALEHVVTNCTREGANWLVAASAAAEKAFANKHSKFDAFAAGFNHPYGREYRFDYRDEGPLVTRANSLAAAPATATVAQIITSVAHYTEYLPECEALLSRFVAEVVLNSLPQLCETAVVHAPNGLALGCDLGRTLMIANLAGIMSALQTVAVDRNIMLSPLPPYPTIVGEDCEVQSPGPTPISPPKTPLHDIVSLTDVLSITHRLVVAATVSAIAACFGRVRSGAVFAPRLLRTTARAARAYLATLPAGDWAMLTVAPVAESPVAGTIPRGTITECAVLLHEALADPFAQTALAEGLQALGHEGERAVQMISNM